MPVMLALLLTFGLMFVGCDNDGGEDYFTLSIDVADGSKEMGSVSITSGSPAGNSVGAAVTITATPASGYHFVRWSNNVAGMYSVSTDTSYTFTINANTLLCAVFHPDNNITGIIDLTGTWVMDFGRGVPAVTVVTGNTGTLTVGSPGDYYYYDDSGSCTRDGNYGLLHSDNFDADIGMFAITSETTVTAYLVKPNPITGTYYGTKQQ
jgi:hypothetical protein